jgi:4a-hydroxytetrahydrobiopterin dehydratase
MTRRENLPQSMRPVALDQAEARIAAALAAGGNLLSDAHAPLWWVLADAEGNEACVATWVGRA